MISRLSLPKWHDVLLAIYKARDSNRYCEKLNRKLQSSLTHVREIVRLLADHNLVAIQASQKVKQLDLTDKGRKVALWIMNIKSELNKP